MARDKVSEWSSTAAQNTVIADININEGCPPSTINNAIRELMAQVKDFQTGADGDGLTVGGNLVVSGTATISGNVTLGNVSLGAVTATSLNVSGSSTMTTATFSSVVTDSISEKTSAAGVTVDGLLVKDGGVNNPTVTNYVESVVAIGTVTSSHTISLTNGTVQTATLTASTACTFTMPTATAGKSFILLLKQAASTGNGTATFTGVKWDAGGAPTVTSTAGKMDIFTFIADGTNWYGSYSKGYTP
jgi:hypothetical protein